MDLFDLVNSDIKTSLALAETEGERALYWIHRGDEQFAGDSAQMAAHFARHADSLNERYFAS